MPAKKKSATAHSHAPHAMPDAGDEQALGQWLDAARAHCAHNGAQLTEQRREVLELLLHRRGSAKAYDLQDDMQTRHGRVAPTTVYRALDFLMEQRLVHKVDATNTYVVCTDAEHDHPSMMLVCTQCGEITEWHDDPQFDALSAQVARYLPGFAAQGLEIKGLCARCSAAAAHAGG
ncbi:Fur family transcriptional regulator [Acidovorax sp.]|uniref:Fur family transcriptional regulator n=1 Tax=Acidovorax sp. TaxID=1872122 RepID=UPI0039195BCB